MEQYLEEKKASQKRPTATFQRQDKKKTVYQTPQKPVAVSNSQMKDYDCILGLDWLEEHYALVYCRRKKIVFRIPGEDEFSHPLPKNLAGKIVISAMKAMRMVNKGCDAFLASFWPKATLASSPGRLGGVSVQRWTPTLILASSDMDSNLSGQHAQQSCKLLKQGIVGDMAPLEETVETDSERGD
ncbi:hypothetical protein Taro_050300 [Colocasia esculenta]|uniref:Reverse transcriptase domain-containing protein n=1 Tax=Colocasia esculenta TaxID=4460 RepID=A0A843XD38_COLES|nr:hypothetical protein [Colocasia esculenta]